MATEARSTDQVTPERWQQIKTIFEAAVELDPADRNAYLDRTCSGDESLRRQVESLLSSDQQGWDWFERPAYEYAADLLDEEQPALTAGDEVSHYRVLGLLGTGGMGEVYIARDSSLGREVALKILPPNYVTKDRLQRFRREARTASALNHPNIVTIYEISEIKGRHFIATEFVNGETLRQRLKRSPLNLSEALDIAMQVCGALAAAHQAGIVHRDIKPENIMLRRDGYVKVLDFGLAKLAEQREPMAAANSADKVDVSSGLVMGTVKYMSPEQARGLDVDSRSDIFSLGVLLYEMVTGHAPFKGEAAEHLVRSILEDEPPPLTAYTAYAPEELQRIVSKALSKDKAKRFKSAQDLIVDLKTLTASTQNDDVRAASTIEYFVSQIREHRTIAAAALISLVILLAGLGYPLRKWISKRAVASKVLKTIMLTTTGNVYEAAISPDGKYLAYFTWEGGLQIRELATNEDTQVVAPGGRNFGNPAFAADGKYLYYQQGTDDTLTPIAFALYRIPVLGGPSEKIVDHIPINAALSPDGEKLAFVRSDLNTGLGTLVIANVDGTEERSIIARQAPNYFATSYYRRPSWAPDGKHIAYVAVNASDGYERIFELNLETQLEKPLTSQKWDYGIKDLAWLPDSTGILITASNSSISSAIWRLSYPGTDLQRITNDANKYDWLSVASDSNSLVTTQVMDYSELWIAPDADASRSRRIMPGSHDGWYGFGWTTDRRIVYTSETSGNSDIWTANSDGTNKKQLTSNAHLNAQPAVTSDGRYIVFQSNRTGADHIWRMDIDGGNQKQLTFGAAERDPACSPDAKWVVYTAWETGKATIWKVLVEGGTPQQITDVQCAIPRVSHDGKLIACGSGSTGRRVLMFSFEGGQPINTVELPQDAHPVGWLGWTLNDQAIIYGKFLDGVQNYWLQPIDGGRPKQLTFFNRDQRATPRGYGREAWSPDGRDLLFAGGERRSDVVMMTGLK